MNGAHDLGGKHGFGPIDQSQTDNFTADWEEKVFGLTLCCGMLGHWNLDQSRYARESTDPANYLAASYYEHWLHGLELLLLKNGIVSAQEMRTGKCSSLTTDTAATPEKVKQVLANGAPTLLSSNCTAKFEISQTVVVKNENSKEHTRAPAYIKGVAGHIVKNHGTHIYADEHALSGKKTPQHLYSVRFEAKSIWGDTAEPGSCVYVDLFEPYLLSIAEYKQSLPA